MSKIDWTDKTWNPITGCTNGIDICPIRNECYARRMAKRLQQNPMTANKYKKGFDLAFHQDELDKPSQWKKPCKIFVGSMADLWCKGVPDKWIEEVLFECRNTENEKHIFQFLTKNPQRFISYCQDIQENHYSVKTEDIITPNCWLGFTDINNIDIKTIKELRESFPDHILFVSYEPFTKWRWEIVDLVDWVIVGGWSGDKNGNRYNVEQIVEISVLIERCKRLNKPVFVKSNLKQYLPESFYIQQFPEVKP